MPMYQVIRLADDLPIEWRNFAWDIAKMTNALAQDENAMPLSF